MLSSRWFLGVSYSLHKILVTMPECECGGQMFSGISDYSSEASKLFVKDVFGMSPTPETLNSKSEPSTLNPQLSTLNLNPQPSILNPQPSTLNPQPSTLNPQS